MKQVAGETPAFRRARSTLVNARAEESTIWRQKPWF